MENDKKSGVPKYMECDELKKRGNTDIRAKSENTWKKRLFSILIKNMQVRKILTAESYFSGVITSVTIEKQ